MPTPKSNQGPTGKYMVLGIIIFKRILSERLNKLLNLSSVVDPFHFDPDPRIWIWIILKTDYFFYGLIIHVKTGFNTFEFKSSYKYVYYDLVNRF